MCELRHYTLVSSHSPSSFTQRGQNAEYLNLGVVSLSAPDLLREQGRRRCPRMRSLHACGEVEGGGGGFGRHKGKKGRFNL